MNLQMPCVLDNCASVLVVSNCIDWLTMQLPTCLYCGDNISASILPHLHEARSGSKRA
jgi:hypothetical protein